MRLLKDFIFINEYIAWVYIFEIQILSEDKE